MAKRKPKDTAMQVQTEDKARAKVERSVAERLRGGRGTATVERLLQADGGKAKTNPEGYETDSTGRQRIVAAPLDRLHKDGKITRREFEAGDKYRADAYLSAIDPTTGSVDWASAGGGGRSSKVPSMFESQHIYDARKRWRDLNDKMKRGSVVSSILYLALIHERSIESIGENIFGAGNHRDARNAGYGGFRVALGALADLYNM
ncbi:hypothetical protein [Bauldia litoralis]|uniref:hypothetical protein n=1 Tax=Bauldia litoralis TaxID=665467 RepID=UPI00326396A9